MGQMTQDQITVDLFDEVKRLQAELAKEKADHADTQRQWNEALDVGLKVVAERDKLRSALMRTHGSLGLIIRGARAGAEGHKANYEYGSKVLDETC